MDGLTVSDLAGELGISPDAVRYYEKIGLLPQPKRSPSGYRLYDGEAVERARFVKRAQRFGLRLADIAGLVEVRDRGLCPCGGTRRLLEARVAELDDEMTALSRLRQDIATMLEEPETSGRETEECGSLCRSEGMAPGGGTGLDEHRRVIRNHNTMRKSMSTSVNQCECNTTQTTGPTTTTTTTAEPCTCGCCAPPAANNERRIAELRSLRDSIDRELAVLERA